MDELNFLSQGVLSTSVGAPCSSGVGFLDQNKLKSGFFLKLKFWNPMLQKLKANAFFFFFTDPR